MSDTPTLPPVDPRALVRSALSHLQAAEGQSCPSDDQIIIGHLRTAIELLKPVAWPGSER